MQGIELNKPAGPVVAKAIDLGLLLVGAGQFIIRLCHLLLFLRLILILPWKF